MCYKSLIQNILKGGGEARRGEGEERGGEEYLSPSIQYFLSAVHVLILV